MAESAAITKEPLEMLQETETSQESKAESIGNDDDGEKPRTAIKMLIRRRNLTQVVTTVVKILNVKEESISWDVEWTKASTMPKLVSTGTMIVSKKFLMTFCSLVTNILMK